MEGLHGNIPVMDCESRDLVSAWKTFHTHVQFIFSGSLKDETDEEKSSYLMIRVGPYGKEVFGTWDLSDAEKEDPVEIGNRFKD